MVHKKFENPTASHRESTWIDRTPNPRARNYLDEMAPINGYHVENAESIRMRDAFRDEVSKRMGELLLKGQTMLDEYCPTCSGILMEDRTGVRRCVTCELYQEKLQEAGQVIAEIPLQEEDLQEAIDAATPSPAVEKTLKKEVKVSSPVVKKAAAKKASKLPEASSESPITLAKEAVLRKLTWASEKLEETSETARILDFLAVIQKSAETLEALNI